MLLLLKISTCNFLSFNIGTRVLQNVYAVICIRFLYESGFYRTLMLVIITGFTRLLGGSKWQRWRGWDVRRWWLKTPTKLTAKSFRLSEFAQNNLSGICHF